MIIMSYAQVAEPIPQPWTPTVVFVDQANRIVEVAGEEKANTRFADIVPNPT